MKVSIKEKTREKIFRTTFVVAIFSLLNGLIGYLVSYNQYSSAPGSAKRLNIVEEPSVVHFFAEAFVIVLALYCIYRLLLSFKRSLVLYPYITGFILLLITVLFIVFIKVRSDDTLSIRAIVMMCIMWGSNFFIPYADKWIKRVFYVLFWTPK